jgi:hypothetical protein
MFPLAQMNVWLNKMVWQKKLADNGAKTSGFPST